MKLKLLLGFGFALIVIFPPIVVVMPVTVTGWGFSHLTEETRELENGGGGKRVTITPVNFNPAHGRHVVCRVGHRPVWHYLTSLRRKGVPQVFAGTHKEPSRSHALRIADSELSAAVDWPLVLSEMAILLAVYVVLRSPAINQQPAPAPELPSAMTRR